MTNKRGKVCTFENTDPGDRVVRRIDGDTGRVTAVRRDDTATVYWDQGIETSAELGDLRHEVK